jgi:uncharacterized repeat protein (TIGR03803 family)
MNRNITLLRKPFWHPLTSLSAPSLGLLLSGVLAISTLAQTYSILHDFADPGGGQFPATPLVCAGTTLYGMSNGKLFKVNTDGSGFTVLHDTGFHEWVQNSCGIVLSGSTLYVAVGMEYWAIPHGGYGILFRIATDGTGYTLMKQFTRDQDGGFPNTTPVLSGNTLYGTAGVGGNSDLGVIWKINTNGSGFTVIKHFTGGSDGASPYASLLLSGSVLYGTTQSGGVTNASYPYGMGTVFEVNTDGSGYTVLHQFLDAGEGASPQGPLALSEGMLYGTATSGHSGAGTIFKIRPDGSGLAVVKNFAGGSDGSGPRGNLVLAGTTLYGATYRGGSSDKGTLFKVNTDGSGFLTLKRFNGTDGCWPWAGMVLSGTTLYGTTSQGGRDGNSGVVFALVLPTPAIQFSPRSQTAELGSVVRFSVDAIPAPLTYLWYFKGTNVSTGNITNGGLDLTNVQAGHCGAYTVVVSNEFGAATSSPAMLSVVPPVSKSTVPAVRLAGSLGIPLHLVCANTPNPIAGWQDLGLVTLTATPQFYPDTTQPLATRRFYRAWQTNVLSPRPVLQMSLATELMLTGAVGSPWRVDYINQYGPTGAWVALDAVTLTNTTQPYFDYTMFDQPARLYRLVPMP